MPDTATTIEVLPLEERGWRVAALRDLVWFCLSTARIVYRMINDPKPVERRYRADWPWLLGRLVRGMRQFERLMELTRAGVGYVSPVPRTPKPVNERRSRSHSLSPRGPHSLVDAGVPGADGFRYALSQMLAEENTAALLLTDPRAARLARMLCRLCGLRPEDVLYPMPAEKEPPHEIVLATGEAAYEGLDPEEIAEIEARWEAGAFETAGQSGR